MVKPPYVCRDGTTSSFLLQLSRFSKVRCTKFLKVGWGREGSAAKQCNNCLLAPPIKPSNYFNIFKLAIISISKIFSERIVKPNNFYLTPSIWLLLTSMVRVQVHCLIKLEFKGFGLFRTTAKSLSGPRPTWCRRWNAGTSSRASGETSATSGTEVGPGPGWTCSSRRANTSGTRKN